MNDKCGSPLTKYLDITFVFLLVTLGKYTL